MRKSCYPNGLKAEKKFAYSVRSPLLLSSIEVDDEEDDGTLKASGTYPQWGLARAKSIAEISEDLEILIYYRKERGRKMKRRYD